MSRFLEHDAHALEVFASHSSLGRGSLSNCRASICSEVHSLTSLQKGVNLSKPFQPATVCLSKIHWNILKPPNRRFFFWIKVSDFWNFRISILCSIPIPGNPQGAKTSSLQDEAQKSPPQLQVGKKIPNCYIRAFHKEPFLPFKKHDFVFRTWFGEVFVWVFEMLGLEIDLLFIKIIEFDFSWVDQCHVKCLFIKPTTKSWRTNRLDTINGFLGSLFDQLMVNWWFG